MKHWDQILIISRDMFRYCYKFKSILWDTKNNFCTKCNTNKKLVIFLKWKTQVSIFLKKYQVKTIYKMHHNSNIFGLISVMLLSFTSASIYEDKLHDGDKVAPIDKRQGGYRNNLPSSSNYNTNPYNYENNNYINDAQDLSGYQDGLERQDDFTGDTLSIFAAGLAAGAAIAATIALIQNSNQPSTDDFNSLKDRVSSLETDQTSICTSVKAFASADDGKTIDAGYDATTTAELGYLTALAAAASPTCSWLEWI